MDLQKLREGTEQGIPRHLPMRTQAQLDTYTESMSTAIATAIDIATPQIRIHKTYTRREFNQETATAIGRVRKARRKWQARQDDESREEYRAANQQKARAIARSNRDDHRERVAEVDSPRTLWKLA